MQRYGSVLDVNNTPDPSLGYGQVSVATDSKRMNEADSSPDRTGTMSDLAFHIPTRAAAVGQMDIAGQDQLP